MSNKKVSKLTSEDKKMLKEMKRKTWLLFTNFNMANYQGTGYATAMLPAIKRFYADNFEKKTEAMDRSLQFFNCTYETAPFIMGLNASMEKENAEKSDFDAGSISGIKAALMGPASAIGDSIFWGVVRLVFASIAIPIAAAGNVLGPILFLLLYNIASYFTRSRLLTLGYSAGKTFLASMNEGNLLSNLTFAISLVGVIMIGAMSAQFVTIAPALTFTFKGGEQFVLATVLDGIFKGLLPLGIVFGFLALIRKRVNFMIIVFGSMIVGIIGVFAGII